MYVFIQETFFVSGQRSWADAHANPSRPWYKEKTKQKQQNADDMTMAPMHQAACVHCLGAVVLCDARDKIVVIGLIIIRVKTETKHTGSAQSVQAAPCAKS